MAHTCPCKKKPFFAFQKWTQECTKNHIYSLLSLGCSRKKCSQWQKERWSSTSLCVGKISAVKSIPFLGTRFIFARSKHIILFVTFIAVLYTWWKYGKAQCGDLFATHKAHNFFSLKNQFLKNHLVISQTQYVLFIGFGDANLFKKPKFKPFLHSASNFYIYVLNKIEVVWNCNFSTCM